MSQGGDSSTKQLCLNASTYQGRQNSKTTHQQDAKNRPEG